MEVLISLAGALVLTSLLALMTRSERPGPHEHSVSKPTRPTTGLSAPPRTPVFARLAYESASGDLWHCQIERPRVHLPSDDEQPPGFSAYCRVCDDECTFDYEGVQHIWFLDDGTRVEDHDLVRLNLMVRLGYRPLCTIPEVPPGWRGIRRKLKAPIHVVVRWSEVAGLVKTFDVTVDEIEMARDAAFAFSGIARCRTSASQWSPTRRKRFKLRGWDTPDAPISLLALPDEEDRPIAQPHRWLVAVTDGDKAS